MKKCKKCGKAMKPASSKGRPATFCSAACRRSAEFEIKRINRRIEVLETRLSEARLDVGGPPGPVNTLAVFELLEPVPDDYVEVPYVERLETEIKHLEKRLLEILQD